MRAFPTHDFATNSIPVQMAKNGSGVEDATHKMSTFSKCAVLQMKGFLKLRRRSRYLPYLCPILTTLIKTNNFTPGREISALKGF